MRPIDADALVASLEDSYKELRKLYDEIKDDDGAKEVYRGELITFLEAILRAKKAPTLDYAPVVRCKDCMWWKTGGCWFHQPGKCVEREENDFCSDGQRRVKDEAHNHCL